METTWEPIGVHTKYTYAQMKMYQNFHIRKTRHIVFGVLLLWIVANLYFFVRQSLWVAGSAFSFALFTLLLVFILVIFSGILYTKKRHDEATKMIQKGFFFEFHQDGFFARNNVPDFERTRKIMYETIYRIYQQGDMLYLYTDKKNSFMVDLERASGRREELLALLAEKVSPKAYKVKQASR